MNKKPISPVCWVPTVYFAMVSNLLVVLCADEAAQPVVNTGTLNH